MLLWLVGDQNSLRRPEDSSEIRWILTSEIPRLLPRDLWESATRDLSGEVLRGAARSKLVKKRPCSVFDLARGYVIALLRGRTE